MLLCRLDITLLIVREANALEDGLFRRRESRERVYGWDKVFISCRSCIEP